MLRTRQWSKNLLVFLPVVTSHTLSDPATLRHAIAAFLALSFAASAQYICNDWLDRDADRPHPSKCHRPLANGGVSPRAAAILALLSLLFSLAVCLATPGPLLAWTALYFTLSLFYSFRLKKIPLLDVFALAGLYTLRIVIGGSVTGNHASAWLLSFSVFFFLALAFLKRYVEVSRLAPANGAALEGRGYAVTEAIPLLIMGLASSFTSALVLSLYVDTRIAERLYHRPALLWLIVPLCLFWLCRFWLLAARDQVDDDPVFHALRDRGSWTAVLLAAAVYTAATL
jgi:4-hydroxybenzoate polyprenyltransferase